MGEISRGIELAGAEPARLSAAVRAVLTEQHERGPTLVMGRLPAPARIREGAAAASLYFQGLLELGYLVASADGLAGTEREALASLLEQVSGKAIDREALLLHFRDLDEATEALGRRERLVRVAAQFGDQDSRAEAIGFAALVAMADGRLDATEVDVLVELGAQFGMNPRQVDLEIRGVARRVEEWLR
jgi:tellurite resistance protein